MSQQSLLWAPPLSKQQIEVIAWELRKQMGLDRRCDIPILHILEIVTPKIIENFELHILTVEEFSQEFGKTSHGLYVPEQKHLYLREDVYYGAWDNNGRDRFTVAHEFAHAILIELFPQGLHRIASNVKRPTYQDPEWQANTLASYLLIPPKLIGNEMTVENIMNNFSVSFTAAKIAHSNYKKSEQYN